MGPDYEGFQKEITAAYKKAGVPWRMVFESVFGDVTEFMNAYPVEKFAELDGPSPVEKALGKDGYARIRATAGKLLSGSTRMAIRPQPDLSINNQMKAPPQYAMISAYHIVPGHMAQFRTWLKEDYMPAMQKGEVPVMLVSNGTFGTQGNTVLILRYMANLAEIDAGPLLTKVLGSEGAAKVNSKLAGLVADSQTRIWKVRHDLGYAAPPQTARAGD